jgi:hypothetical protein
MPYQVRSEGDKHCVYNAETGEKKACHATKEEADRQVRLLQGIEHGMVPHE